MTPFLLISAVVATYMCKVDGQQSCQLPGTGGRGQCVDVHGCPQLAALLQKADRSPQEVQLLRQAHCGFAGSTPMVCCPAPCRTPERAAGRCVNVYSCPHIANRLTPPVSQETVKYVQNSRCPGLDQFSVCCGPEAAATPAPPAPPPGTCELTDAPPAPSSQCCGRDSDAGNRITGGNDTSIEQYPWLVVIEYEKDARIKLLCGGALISGRYVLTAAHCVIGAVLNAGAPKNVRLGEYDTTHAGPDCVATEGGGEDCTDGVLVLPIARTAPHPGYSAASRRHDIALIRMAKLAPYTYFIRPICLPSAQFAQTAPAGTALWVAGWGALDDERASSNIKQHVSVPYVPLAECQPAYSVPRRTASLWRGQLCAGGEKDKDSCKGDSGGPLMYAEHEVYQVVGVVSFGPVPCGIESVPGVYTNVREYDDWIRRTIAAG